MGIEVGVHGTFEKAEVGYVLGLPGTHQQLGHNKFLDGRAKGSSWHDV